MDRSDLTLRQTGRWTRGLGVLKGVGVEGGSTWMRVLSSLSEKGSSKEPGPSRYLGDLGDLSDLGDGGDPGLVFSRSEDAQDEA